MTGKFFIAILAICSLTACKSKAKSALEFSNAMVAKETAISPVLSACETRVKQYYGAQEFSKIGEEGTKMETQVQNTIDELKKIPAPDVTGADKFKAAYVEYFEFIKSRYTAYKNFGSATTDEDRQKGFEEIRKVADATQMVLTKTRQAQETFAKENGFKLESK